MSQRWRRLFVSSSRLAVLGAAMACLHHATKQRAHSDADLLPLAQSVVAGTTSIGHAREGLMPLLDAHEQTLGWLGTTTEQAQQWIGYKGPSEAVIFFDSQHRVQAVRLRRSADTAGHVAKVVAHQPFWQQWIGKKSEELASDEPSLLVSGASLTSEAIARGIAQRFGAPAPVNPAAHVDFTSSGATTLFPQATSWQAGDINGCWKIFASNQLVGFYLNSTQMGLSARGFNGPSEVVIGLDPDATRVLGVRILASRDNAPYWQDVAQEWSLCSSQPTVSAFLQSLQSGESVPVSGASITNAAIEKTLLAMLTQFNQPRPTFWQSKNAKSLLAVSWMALAVLMAKRKGLSKSQRLVWSGICVAAGLGFGWMLGQDQLLGWAERGSVRGVATPLLVITAAALLLPTLMGKNIYCSHVCPHGAAQGLLGSLKLRRWVISARWHTTLRAVPWLTLVGLWLLAGCGSIATLSMAEPFEVWSAGFYAVIPTGLFFVGLILSCVIPQFYCHYGCPTGALLRWLAHSPSHFTQKDWIALGLVASAWGIVLIC